MKSGFLAVLSSLCSDISALNCLMAVRMADLRPALCNRLLGFCRARFLDCGLLAIMISFDLRFAFKIQLIFYISYVNSASFF